MCDIYWLCSHQTHEIWVGWMQVAVIVFFRWNKTDVVFFSTADSTVPIKTMQLKPGSCYTACILICQSRSISVFDRLSPMGKYELWRDVTWEAHWHMAASNKISSRLNTKMSLWQLQPIRVQDTVWQTTIEYFRAMQSKPKSVASSFVELTIHVTHILQSSLSVMFLSDILLNTVGLGLHLSRNISTSDLWPGMVLSVFKNFACFQVFSDNSIALMAGQIATYSLKQTPFVVFFQYYMLFFPSVPGFPDVCVFFNSTLFWHRRAAHLSLLLFNSCVVWHSATQLALQ